MFGLLKAPFNAQGPLVIAVDFDGTCVTHEFPRMGKDVPYAIDVLRYWVRQGHKIVLNTMRSDQKERKYLSEAIAWFKINGIPLYGVNSNPGQRSWTSSPKTYAHFYVDDAALGCPLIKYEGFSERPFVDWIMVDKLVQQHQEFYQRAGAFRYKSMLRDLSFRPLRILGMG